MLGKLKYALGAALILNFVCVVTYQQLGWQIVQPALGYLFGLYTVNLQFRFGLFFWSLLLSLLWLAALNAFLAKVERAAEQRSTVPVIPALRVLGSLGLAMSSVLMNEGWITSRGLVSRACLFAVGSILSSEAALLLQPSTSERARGVASVATAG